MSKDIKIKDSEVIRLIGPLQTKAERWQEQLSEQRKKCSELYHMEKLGNEQKGWSQAVASVVWDAVEWLKPGLSSIFAHPDFAEIRMDDLERAKRIKKAVRFQMFRKNKGKREIRAWLHDTLLYHYGVFKVYHKTDFDLETLYFERLSLEEMEQLVNDPDIQITKYKEVETEVPLRPDEWLVEGESEVVSEVHYEKVKAVRREVNYAGPCVECVPATEFYYVPGHKDLDTNPFVAHRKKKTLHDIKRGEVAGQYAKGSHEKVAAYIQEGGESSEIEHEISALYGADDLVIDETGDLSIGMNEEDKPISPNSEVYVWECYLRMDIDQDGLLEPVIATICGDVVLQLEKNPYKRPPFRVGRLYEVAHRFEAKPLPLVLRDDQMELTNLQRILVDAAADSTYGNIVTSDPEFAKQWSGRQIGDVILSQAFDKFSEVRPSQPGGILLQAKEAVRLGSERKTGVSSLNQGIDDNSYGKTATGVMALQGAAQQRQKFNADVLADTMEEVFRDCVEINKLFPPNSISQPGLKQEHRIQPGDFDINDDYDIKVNIGIGLQDRHNQASILENHFKKVVQVLLPMGLAKPEHLLAIENAIGKLLDTPVDGFQCSEDEFNEFQKVRNQCQQLAGELQNAKQQLAAVHGGTAPANGNRGAGPEPAGQPVFYGPAGSNRSGTTGGNPVSVRRPEGPVQLPAGTAGPVG
ncbi:portal protein [Maridesulfovibrio sp.]|uniref:portal protein n=1 Tax=Maridesulfovibrio sp. TaxID=2795000 RepID=UPI003BA8D119